MIRDAFSGGAGRAACVALLCGAFGLAGCTPPPPPIPSSKARLGKERCGELVDSAFAMLKPQSLGIESNLDAAASVLNEWLSTCGETQGSAALGSEHRSLFEVHLPESYLERVADDRFAQRDGTHIRDCFLWKDTHTFAVRTAENDLGRIVELFNYVIRNIALDTKEDNPIPLTPFEIMVLGRGTAEDRAWLFADILRQLRIDTVILRPGGEGPPREAGDQAAWLVGAFLDNDVYLFEPRLGTPVPSLERQERAAAVEQPATLAEAAENDDVLRQLDRSPEKPYPLKAADLASLRVEVIGNTGFWSPRMRLLQQSLSGDRSVIIYDSLVDTEAGPGLLTRAVDHGRGRWSREDVAVWRYPEENLQGAEDRDARQNERLFLRQAHFGWPFEVRQEDETKRIIFGRPTRGQLKIRLKQITGELGQTTQFYNAQMESVLVQLRTQGIDVPPDLQIPPMVQRMQAQAAEDARFWTGVCQFEIGEHAAAADSFREYLSRYRAGGDWSAHSRFLRAWSYAELGEYDVAARILEQAPSTDPQADGYPVLVRRWKEFSEAKRGAAEPQTSGATGRIEERESPADGNLPDTDAPEGAAASAEPSPPAKPQTDEAPSELETHPE